MLTTAQLHELAATLRDTRQNVYAVAKRLFGVDVDDGVFDKLIATADLFRCDECGCWAGMDEYDSDISGMCVPCAAWIAAGVE